MKFLLFFTVSFFLAFSQGSAILEVPVSSRMNRAARESLNAKIRAIGGCNANVCFAIDGSGAINQTEFQSQQQFVIDMVSIIGVDSPVEVAAVQYTVGNSPISPLTPNVVQFSENVVNAKQLGGSSFVQGGINYCFLQLFQRQGEANKIVLLGDGRTNIGTDSVNRADLFRSIGGDVCVVGAGFSDKQQLLEIAGGKSENVFQVGSFLNNIQLGIVLEQIVEEICGIEAENSSGDRKMEVAQERRTV